MIAVPYSNTVTVPVERLLANSATIQSSVLYVAAGATTGVADAGVTVTLLDGAGNQVATTVTDANGAFSFANLAAGSYEVEYTAPSGQVLVIGSTADATTGLTPTMTLAAGQTLTLASELLEPPASIQAYTLHFDAPTDPQIGTKIAGVTVSLLNAAGQVIATAVSTPWTGVIFSNIAAGTYELEYTAPSGEVIAPGAPEDTTTGITAPFTVAAGQAVAGPNGWLAGVAVEPDRNGAAGECRGGGRCGVAAERQRQRRREHDDRHATALTLSAAWPPATTR